MTETVMLDTTPERPYAGGCIRFTAAGPQWYQNDHHATVGFDTSIPPEILTNGRMRLVMLSSHIVVSASASPDETLVEREISAGISGGVSDCNISMVRAGMGRRLQLDDPAEYALVAGEFSNLWVYIPRIVATA